jgi:phage N-6-adenine-methyltransferase
MARLRKQFESATVEWPTPDSLWKPLHDEFGFTLDVCATDENAKCSRYYTRHDDGLVQPWSGVCWMNPPYGREMVAWLKRAESEKANGVTTVALIPSRTNTGWWHDIVMPNEVRFVRGRPKFGNADQGLPWPLAVVVFRSNALRQPPLPAGGNTPTKDAAR